MKFDINEYTHVIDKSKKITKNHLVHTDKQVSAYAFDGHGKKNIVDPNAFTALAKSEKFPSSTFYYVKLGKRGNKQGYLANPKDPLFKLSDLTDQMGNNKIFDWHLVKEKLFTSYLNFLITGETKWLKDAQRKLQTES